MKVLSVVVSGVTFSIKALKSNFLLVVLLLALIILLYIGSRFNVLSSLFLCIAWIFSGLLAFGLMIYFVVALNDFCDYVKSKILHYWNYLFS